MSIAERNTDSGDALQLLRVVLILHFDYIGELPS